MKSRSATGETLAELMRTVHDQVKDHLEKSVTKYKDKAYQKEIHFNVRDLVMAFLNKDRLPKTASGVDMVFVVVDRFRKNGSFYTLQKQP